MKLSFVFPIIKKENILDFWEEFKKSHFFGMVDEYESIFVVSKTDSNNINSLSEIVKKDKNIKVVVMNKDFVYNRAFREALPYITGEITLLGDVGIDNNGEIFLDMLKEYEDGADVVQVKFERRGFGGFIKRCADGVYNFFVRMFSENRDILNIPSLALFERTVIDIFKALPLKANFLRNAYYLEGINMRTLYINKTTPVYKNKFDIKTGGLIAACILSGATLLCALAIILTNVLLSPPVILNIGLVLVLVISFLSIFIALSKHILDVRCDKVYMDVKMTSTINTEERPEPDIKVKAKPKTNTAKKSASKAQPKAKAEAKTPSKAKQPAAQKKNTAKTAKKN